jgi:hypothetical protein
MRSDLLAVLCLGGALLVQGCLADAPLKLPYDDVPVAREDGWRTGTPESQGLDPAKLRQAYERFYSETDPDYVPAVSLLVVRNGVLVAEGYSRDRADIDRPGAIVSATKSFTSLLVGMARAQGHLDSLDAPLSALLPEAVARAPDKGPITLRQLLTMRSGLDFDNTRFSLEMEHDARDGLGYVLGQPLLAEPGGTFDYKDADPYLVGAVLQARMGRPMGDFAREHLFGPLGITHYRWLEHADGTTYGPWGLYLTPRDMARVGQLLLQRGQWEGRQLVPEDWLDESTRARPPPDSVRNDAGLAHYGLGYGYYWWVSAEHRAFFASGHGGQYILVRPDLQLVVVLTAEPDTKSDLTDVNPRAFLALVDLITDAVR